MKIKDIQLSDEAIFACVIGERESAAKLLVDEGNYSFTPMTHYYR